MANTNKVRLRYAPETPDGETGDQPEIADVYVSANAAKVYLKHGGWRPLTEDELASEARELEDPAGAAGDESTAAPDADTKAAAPRGRGKGAAEAAEKEG